MKKIMADNNPFYYVCPRCGSYADIDVNPWDKDNWTPPQNSEQKQIWLNFKQKESRECPECKQIDKLLSGLD